MLKTVVYCNSSKLKFIQYVYKKTRRPTYSNSTNIDKKYIFKTKTASYSYSLSEKLLALILTIECFKIDRAYQVKSS